MTRVTVVTVLLLAGWARALPTVAVMPFKDLTATPRGSIGEAIRETLTSDLREVPGMKVIERSFIDRVLAEQNLQAARSDLDPLSTVKVGKLLGASLMVAGAYQRAASTVRITARFVKVETGEIVGSAKVDGPATDFLRVQDRVTAELLRSLGIERAQVQRVVARPRPKLKSLKPVELYGDAVVEPNDLKRRELLLAAVSEEPAFAYAARDLDALEKRLKQLEALRQEQLDAQTQALVEQLRAEQDSTRRTTLFMQLYGKLATARRWMLLARLSRQLLEDQPPEGLVELLGFNIVQAAVMSKDHDRVLREGEAYLVRHPSGTYFDGVKNAVEQALEWKRAVAEGKAAAPAAIAALSPEDRADPCRLGLLYNEHKQLGEARRELERCLPNPAARWPASLPLQMLVTVTTLQGDAAAFRLYLKQLEQVDPAAYRSSKGLEWQLAADL